MCGIVFVTALCSASHGRMAYQTDLHLAIHCKFATASPQKMRAGAALEQYRHVTWVGGRTRSPTLRKSIQQHLALARAAPSIKKHEYQYRSVFGRMKSAQGRQWVDLHKTALPVGSPWGKLPVSVGGAVLPPNTAVEDTFLSGMLWPASRIYCPFQQTASTYTSALAGMASLTRGGAYLTQNGI